MNVGVYPPSLAVGDPNLNHGKVTYRACKAGFTGFSQKAGFVVRLGRREGAGRDGPYRRMPCVY